MYKFCMNSECKYYWEDNCTLCFNDETKIPREINGKCESFKEGVNDWYEADEIAEKFNKLSMQCEYIGESVNKDFGIWICKNKATEKATCCYDNCPIREKIMSLK